MVFETIELIRNIKGYDGVGVSIFIPYYGTKLREYAIEKGWLDFDIMITQPSLMSDVGKLGKFHNV